MLVSKLFVESELRCRWCGDVGISCFIPKKAHDNAVNCNSVCSELFLSRVIKTCVVDVGTSGTRAYANTRALLYWLARNVVSTDLIDSASHCGTCSTPMSMDREDNNLLGDQPAFPRGKQSSACINWLSRKYSNISIIRSLFRIGEKF